VLDPEISDISRIQAELLVGQLLVSGQNDYFVSCLDTIICDHPNAGTVLLGDFNRMRDSSLLSYPLKQVVRQATRGDANLHKVYTNISDWYERPDLLPKIGRSDHDAVIMTPKSKRPVERTKD